jgi:hypothetical protein
MNDHSKIARLKIMAKKNLEKFLIVSKNFQIIEFDASLAYDHGDYSDYASDLPNVVHLYRSYFRFQLEDKEDEVYSKIYNELCEKVKKESTNPYAISPFICDNDYRIIKAPINLGRFFWIFSVFLISVSISFLIGKFLIPEIFIGLNLPIFVFLILLVIMTFFAGIVAEVVVGEWKLWLHLIQFSIILSAMFLYIILKVIFLALLIIIK